MGTVNLVLACNYHVQVQFTSNTAKVAIEFRIFHLKSTLVPVADCDELCTDPIVNEHVDVPGCFTWW